MQKPFSHVKSASQFVKELKQMFPKTKWIKIGSFIRTSRNNKPGKSFCPICFAAYKLTGIVYNNTKFKSAAFQIGLNSNTTDVIVAVADGKVKNQVRTLMVKNLVGE